MSSEEQRRSILTRAASSTLSTHLDEDASEYVVSILADDLADEDAREAVSAFLQGSVEDEDECEKVCRRFFELLDDADDGADAGGSSGGGEEGGLPRLLANAVTMKEHDIQTFASGLVANNDDLTEVDAEGNSIVAGGGESEIKSFYANMIDASDNPRAQSERDRRKERQTEIRERMDEEEQKRAIEDAVRMQMEGEGSGAGAGEEKLEGDGSEQMEMTTALDNAGDVHLTNFLLPNRKGGGPDLLTDASLTLAGGRRYGLMGRNGCGKTTLLTALASRQLGGQNGDGVPKNMSMLLVRQEIMGNNLSAVETVLKSDVQREGAKRFIQYIEDELGRLDRGETSLVVGGSATASTEEETKKEPPSKGKQKLKDRKKNLKKPKKAVAKTPAKVEKKVVEEDPEEKRTRLNLQLSRAYERLANIEQEEGGDPEPRARKVLFGLGFTTPEMQDKPTRELSGGWRMRVSLSCALFANPALLLLDEPTNHLDLEAVLWLERYLKKTFRGLLVVVSHDRHFLNEVVTDVVHFHRGQLDTYKGDITSFEAVREENRKRQIRLFEQQEAKREHLQKYIDLHAQSGENGVKASKQRKSRMKKLDKLGVMAQEGKKFKASYDGDAKEIEEYVEDEEVFLNFPDPGGFNGNIVQLEQVSFGYTKEHTLLRDVDLSIDMTSRVALLGRNGCGKSTLIKLIVGALHAQKGKTSLNGRAKVEYLAQHQLEQLDPDGTPIDTMLDRYPKDRGNAHRMELRRYLANFGLGGDELPLQKIHTMSGGQKCRLCIACAMYRKPHLLILDEPTNHLDLETTEALIDAIKGFQGGVLLVSHDQHLLTSVCKHLYVVENGHVEQLKHGATRNETFEQYKKDVILGKR